MRIYLDVSCLNRPFDDQSQTRVRLEKEAVEIILEKCDLSVWQLVSSEIAVLEISRIADADRRKDVFSLLPDEEAIVRITPEVRERALVVEALGIKPADALHVAMAEEAHADIFLTCDDKLLRAGKRNDTALKVRLANPLEWMQEENDDDA
jgi:predicted nucleic acid-binding protein